MIFRLILLITLSSLVACQKAKTPTSFQGVDQTIVSGRVTPEEDPVMSMTVGIYLNRDTGRGPLTQVCTGTLIASDVVLTAAHCADAKVSEDATEYLISFGPKVIATPEDLKNAILRKGLKIKVHEQWKNENILNDRDPSYDLALIRFEGDLPEGAQVAQVAGTGFKAASFEDQIQTVGFGWVDGIKKVRTQEMRDITLKITDWMFSRTHFSVKMYFGGTCNGDSGGPAFLRKEGADDYLLIGVTSFGDPYCKAMGYFVRLPVFSEWVHSETLLLQGWRN